MIKNIVIFGLAIGLFSCKNATYKKYSSEIKELTDKQYPDNNDIDVRSDLWDKYSHLNFEIKRNSTHDFTIIITPENQYSDSIILTGINILSWIPTVPKHIAKDDYLKSIGIINAEWNRQQVKIKNAHFKACGKNEEKDKIVRVDLARNCLNAYAWEIITFTKENNKIKPLYHGWFDFPKELYRNLFDEVNKGILTFEEYREHLENYKDPEKKHLNFEVLRSENARFIPEFNDYRLAFYPMTGARKTKYKNIVCPQNPQRIEDMLNDSTTYSTFQWPGFYDTKDPRSTTLSMLGIPKKVIVKETTSKNEQQDRCFEFDISYARNTDTNYITRVVIGGIKKSQLKQLDQNNYNKGLKMPMGIGNHGFYEEIDYAETHSSSSSPYYGFIVDDEGKWVDSHFFGVDGPLLHLDKDNPNLLHFWLLSFERHAMVSHLTFPLSESN